MVITSLYVTVALTVNTALESYLILTTIMESWPDMYLMDDENGPAVLHSTLVTTLLCCSV